MMVIRLVEFTENGVLVDGVPLEAPTIDQAKADELNAALQYDDGTIRATVLIADRVDSTGTSYSPEALRAAVDQWEARRASLSPEEFQQLYMGTWMLPENDSAEDVRQMEAWLAQRNHQFPADYWRNGVIAGDDQEAPRMIIEHVEHLSFDPLITIDGEIPFAVMNAFPHRAPGPATRSDFDAMAANLPAYLHYMEGDEKTVAELDSLPTALLGPLGGDDEEDLDDGGYDVDEDEDADHYESLYDPETDEYDTDIVDGPDEGL